MSQRQRDDIAILAHIREQHRLSLQSYGRPRVTGFGDPGMGHGCGIAAAAQRLRSSYGSWVAILFKRLSTASSYAWFQGFDEW